MSTRTRTLEKTVSVIGTGHTPFGRLADRSLEDLVTDVVTQALDDAQAGPDEIDAAFIGQFNSGLTPLAFPSSLVLQADERLHGTPVTRVENACASGSAAVHQGIQAVLAGTARTVLVVGVEKMTHAPADLVGSALLGADYELAGRESTTGFAGLFARVAQAYAERYGDVSDAMAMVAAKNHANGVQNPWAQLRKDLGYEFCRTVSDRNPMVADPLRRTDCSPVSDGAAALVLRAGADGGALATVAGFGQANDYLPMDRRDPVAFEATALSIARAMDMAGTTLEDLDLAEVHDCFSIAELVVYEAMGLTPRGEAGRAISEGWTQPDGRLPVNLSGGLKAKGHPVGATGVSQHVLTTMQLSGRAGGMQLPRADVGLVQNMGGLGVANYATVLRSA